MSTVTTTVSRGRHVAPQTRAFAWAEQVAEQLGHRKAPGRWSACVARSYQTDGAHGCTLAPGHEGDHVFGRVLRDVL